MIEHGFKVNGHGVWYSTRVNGKKDSPEFTQALDDLNAAERELRAAQNAVEEAEDNRSDAFHALHIAQTNQRTQT